MAKKTDNHNPKAKLDLRRHFLDKYHADGNIRVFDCCQGSGKLWGVLRDEYPVKSYWGVDVKPKPGRLKIESQRVLTQPGMKENVIDIDTYGSPWKHWEALLPNINQPTTVFLTIGQLTTGTVGSIGNAPLRAMGLGKLSKILPPAFHVKLSKIYLSYSLTVCYGFCINIIEAVEAISDGNARYIGVRLERQQPGCNPAAAKQDLSSEDKSHV